MNPEQFLYWLAGAVDVYLILENKSNKDRDEMITLIQFQANNTLQQLRIPPPFKE